jgi:hypothetical protein
MTLKYHQPIFDLLGVEPIIDMNRLEIVKEIEANYDFKMPDAVKEYFLISNMLDMLFGFSVFLEINPIFLFGQSEDFKGLDDKHLDLLKERKVILLFTERNQSWTWFLSLKNELADPKVMLHSTDFPEVLISHPHKFSKQLYLNVWDALVTQYRSEGFCMKATYKIANNDVLRTLRFAMHEISTTYILITNETTYRFESQGGYIAIVEDGIQAIWHFYAKNEESLKSLIKLSKKIKKLTAKIQAKTIIPENVKALEKKAIIERVLSEMI